MRLSLRIQSALLAAVSAAVTPLTCAAAQTQKPTDPRESAVATATLDNGLTIVALESHASPVVSVWTWYRTGSRDERPGLTGISHLVEHLTYEGTDAIPGAEMTGRIEGVGGAWNGYTFLDTTAYYETVPRESLDAALEIEAARMSGASLPAAALAGAKTAVASELPGPDAPPAEQIDRAVTQTAIAAHPYHWAVTGWLSDLQAISRDDLAAWYHARYVPSAATLVIVGDVKAADAIAAAKKRFDAIPKADPPPAAATAEPPQEGERRVTISRPGPARVLQVSWHAPALGDPDFAALLVADAILGGAKGTNLWEQPDASAPRDGRLGKSLIAPGLATDARSTLLPTRDPFLSTIRVVLADGADAAKTEAAAISAAETLAGEISGKDVDRAKAGLQARLVFEAATPTDVAHQLGLYQSLDPAGLGWRALFRMKGAIDAVSASDVKRVAAKYWNPANRTVGWFLPQATGSHSAASANVRGIAAAHLLGAATPAAPAKPLPDRGPKAVRQTLPNGMVVIADRNPLAPEIEVRVEIAAGSAFELPEKSGVAGLTARLLSAGSAAHPEAEIVQAFEDTGARLDVSTGGGRTVVRARMLAASMPALLPLLDQMVAAPSFPPEAFAREKAAAIADAKRRARDPRLAAELLLDASLFPDKDPRGRDPLGDEKSLEALTRADVGDFDRLNYRPDTTVVSVSGDVDPAEAIRQVTKAFRAWRASGKPPAPQPAGQIAALTLGWIGRAQGPGMTGTAVVVGWPGVARTDKDWLATRALGVVLDRRLGPSLKLPVDTTVEPNESPTAVLVHTSIVPPAKPDEAAKTIGEAVAKLAADGVTSDELALAKSILAGRFDRRLESNAGLAAFLAETERFKLGPDLARRYGPLVDALTTDDLARVAKAQAGGALGTVIVGP